MNEKKEKKALNFKGKVSGGIEALSTLAKIRFDRMFTDFDAIVEAYKVGTVLAREMFGPEISFGGPRWASTGYGHINCLGSKLIFPEDSEVAQTPIYDSLAEGIKALQKDVDFTRAGMFPFYIELWGKIKKAFPERSLSFVNFGAEGPVTTAWLLRGQNFFMDIYDDPPLARQYLALVTASVVKYHQLLARMNGKPQFSPSGMGVADDGAAMIPPGLWPEFVLPYLETYFTALTSGTRSAHIEDLTVDHLRYLDELRLAHYDPSVSKRLTPALIIAHCRVPFTWRLNESELAVFSPQETTHWVMEAATRKVSSVRSGIWRNNCTPRAASNAHAFLRAVQHVQELLEQGCPRECLMAQNV